MPTDFRRHDATAKNLSAPDRQKYSLKKAELIKLQAAQAAADEQLNAFFWQCFEDDDEDEGEDPGHMDGAQTTPAPER